MVVGYLSAIKTAYKLFFIIIPILGVSLLIMFAKNQIPDSCFDDLEGNRDIILNNLKKCADVCWKKHDFGNDKFNEDCYVIKITPNPGKISEEDLNSFYPDAVSEVGFDLEEGITYRLLMRYDGSKPEIRIKN